VDVAAVTAAGLAGGRGCVVCHGAREALFRGPADGQRRGPATGVPVAGGTVRRRRVTLVSVLQGRKRGGWS
jgi:hypothetical protein